MDGDTLSALTAKGWNVFDTLQNNDAYHALKAVDGLIITGATGTNVNDAAVALVGGGVKCDFGMKEGMALMYVDWEYYKIFYYVAKYQNFTKAARVLGNNQPNITHSMNRLESQLNCVLFTRSNRGVTRRRRARCSTPASPRRRCRYRTRRKS